MLLNGEETIISYCYKPLIDYPGRLEQRKSLKYCNKLSVKLR